MIITPPMIQEMMAAGPAASRPFWAPNNQPDPMMEPTEAQIRPIFPTSRIRVEECALGRGEVSVAVMTGRPSCSTAWAPPAKVRPIVAPRHQQDVVERAFP